MPGNVHGFVRPGYPLRLDTLREQGALAEGGYLRVGVSDSLRGRIHEEVTLNWNKWVRESHRWLSIAFTVAVIVNIVAMGKEKPPAWVGLLALVPLVVLLFTGLYLFMLPYAFGGRSGRRTD